jgi:tetratricopeptide (TPR) repeat protein
MATAAADLLAAGWRFHQAGDFARAEQAYRQLLQSGAGQAEARYLLGVLCAARGDLAGAAAQLDEALGLRPAFAPALQQRGVVHARQGQLPEAVSRFREALRLQPGEAETRTNLGLALARQGQYAQAVALLQAVVQQRPDYTRAQNHLREALARQATAGTQSTLARHGVARLTGESAADCNQYGLAYLQQGKFAEAAARFQQALCLRPNDPEAYYHLGTTLWRQNHLEEASACYQHALRLRPDWADAYNQLGEVAYGQKRVAEAETHFREALHLHPDFGAAHYNLGTLLLKDGRMAEARECLQRAVQLKPDFAPGYHNLGLTWYHGGQFEEARAHFTDALRINPNLVDAHWNRAFTWLLLGDLDQGWPEYEWRWRFPDFPYSPPRVFPQPCWDGSPLKGRTILVHAEQGLGDTIQFVRYARLLKEQGACVLVECQRPLMSLLAQGPGIDQLVAQGDPLPPHDVRAPLMSLPYYFQTRLQTLPAQVPYLGADPRLVERWRQKLTAWSGLKIGINWQGNPQYGFDKQRSIPLPEFAPLAELPGVQLVSLQHGPASEQLRAVAGRWPVTDLGGRLDEEAGPFMDRAAVMRNLDLVVTSDTSIAHLAGALGVPVWVALGKVPDWRWLLEREDCPWYPTMRLFRQERAGEWGPVFRRIAQAVRQRLGGPDGGPVSG